VWKNVQQSDGDRGKDIGEVYRILGDFAPSLIMGFGKIKGKDCTYS
jgi:hypothetical protein